MVGTHPILGILVSTSFFAKCLGAGEDGPFGGGGGVGASVSY